MFNQEFKVEGEKVTGRIVGNWSTRSYYAMRLSDKNTLGVDDLDVLISELQQVRNKIAELNEDHEKNNW